MIGAEAPVPHETLPVELVETLERDGDAASAVPGSTATATRTGRTRTVIGES
jgi:hypothetical protein